MQDLSASQLAPISSLCLVHKIGWEDVGQDRSKRCAPSLPSTHRFNHDFKARFSIVPMLFAEVFSIGARPALSLAFSTCRSARACVSSPLVRGIEKGVTSRSF